MVFKNFSDAAEPVLGEAPDAAMQVNRNITEFARLYFNNDAEIRNSIIGAVAKLPANEIEKLAAAPPMQQNLVFAEHAVGARDAATALGVGTADDAVNAYRRNPINFLKGVFGDVAPVEQSHHRSIIEARIADFARETSINSEGAEITTRLLTERLDQLAASGDPNALKNLAGQDRQESYNALNAIVVDHYDAAKAERAAAERNIITTPNGQKWEML